MDVSIIIVNYNTRQLIKDCINSIYAQTKDISFEVIVSDNGSTDGSIEMLKQDFPQIILIENNANLGFGAANNKGLAIANGKYIFYLNSDTILLNNAVKYFFDYWEHNGEKENLGALGCNLVNKDGEYSHSYGTFLNLDEELYNTFHQLYGIYKLSLKLLLFKQITYSPPKHSEKYIGNVDVVIGADLFLKNDENARYDERYFMYHEEQDLQFQLAKQGKIRRIIDEPRIVHLEGKSSEKFRDEIKSLSSFSNIHCTISMFKFFKKNMYPYFSVKILLLKIFNILLWLNPLLFKTNAKYIKNIIMADSRQQTADSRQQTADSRQ